MKLERSPSGAAPNKLATLKLENEKLKKEVEVWKHKLVQAGLSHGVRTFSTSASCPPPVENKPEKPTEKAVTSSQPEGKKAKDTKKKDSGKLFLLLILWLSFHFLYYFLKLRQLK